MSWDFIEVNPLERMSGNWMGGIHWVAEVVEDLLPIAGGYTKQLDATQAVNGVRIPGHGDGDSESIVMVVPG